MEKKPTPIAKAVEEIENLKIRIDGIDKNPRSEYWNGFYLAITEVCAVLRSQEMMEYERDEFIAMANECHNFPVKYFDDTYTQEGGQS